MDSLLLTTEKIRERYAGSKSYVIPSEKIALTDGGFLSTGKNEFSLTFEGLDQFAEITNIPKPFFRTLEPDLRSMIFNRRFQARLFDQRMPHDIRINLNQEAQIIGFDDPKLFRISPVTLMDLIGSSLPKNLSAEKVKVARADIGTKTLQISYVSPENITSMPRASIDSEISIAFCFIPSGSCTKTFFGFRFFNSLTNLAFSKFNVMKELL